MPESWETGPYANDTYLRSLNKSAGDVRRQVGNALTEIGRQRAVNVGQAGKVRGATAGIFDKGLAQTGQDAARLGLQGSMAVSRGLSDGKASLGRVGGLWQQGFGERETRQKGGVRNIQNDLMTDLREKGAEYVSKRQQEDRERAHQQQMAAAQRALQQEMMNRQAAMQQAAMAQAQRQAEEAAAIERYIANSDNPWPVPEDDGALRAQSRYLGMKDRQNR